MNNVDSDASSGSETITSSISGLTLSREDALKFMVERAHFESQLYWTRTNVFLLINAVASGFVIQEQASPGNWTLVSLLLVTGVSLVGVLFGFVWWRMQLISQYYNRVWMADARRLVLNSGDPQLLDRYLYSLGFRPRLSFLKTERGRLAGPVNFRAKREKILGPVSTEVSFEEVNRPPGKSATEYMEQVVIGIIGVWVFTGLLSIGTLIYLGPT